MDPSRSTQSEEAFKRLRRAPLIERMLSGVADLLLGSVCCRGESDGKPQTPQDEPEASTKPEPEAEKSTVSDPTVKPKPKLSTLMWLIALLVAVTVQAWKEIGWRNELRESPVTRMVVLPALWMVLTNAVMATMWAIAMRLSTLRQTWADFNEHHGPRLLFMRKSEPTKPPDPTQGRPTGTEKQGQRMLATIIEREKELRRPPTILDRLLHRKPTGARLRLLLHALQAAAMIAAEQPNIDPMSARALRNKLRKYKRQGVMMVASIKDDDKRRLRMVLDDLPMGMLSEGDSFQLILDTGCTKTGTGYVEDFLPDTLQDLPTPVRMDGIAGGLTIKQVGMVRYEVLDNKSEVQVIETEAFYLPDLKCRLFSPQAYFEEQFKNGADPHEQAELRVRHHSTTMVWANGATLTVNYDQNTFLPRIRAYKNAVQTASALALLGEVDAETNQNLTSAQKRLLRWHFRLGHLGFQTIQWLGRQKMLGLLGEKMAAATLQAPKCAACQFGKQGKTPTPSKHVDQDDVGALSKNKLEPGQLVFMDQYESRVPGRAFTSKGLATSSLTYKGGTLFYDAASGYIVVSHQASSTAAETIESKLRFEREALSSGVSIAAYHTDNGVFTAKEFMRKLAAKGQGIKFSGVSAQFQNGAAENGIKIVVRNARTMMIHTALRWPGYAEKDLWPMALTHAVHLWNQTPKQNNGLSPVEVFTKTQSNYESLTNAHPWGCPVYVLQPKLKDGQKIPKWEPRSKRGQYMGASPMHASTVGLVRNLQTGSITPQFHMVYDDFFETVHSGEEEQPKEWEELVLMQRFKSDYDSEDYVPELPVEWLSTEERLARELRNQQERAEYLDGNRIQGPAARNAPPPVPPPAAPVEPEATVQVAPPAPPPPPAPNPVPRTTVTTSHVRRSTRAHKPNPKYLLCYTAVTTLCWDQAQSLVRCAVGQESDYRYLIAILTDVDCYGAGIDSVHPGVNQYIGAFKANKGKDPDTPTYNEAMNGPDREEFEAAMASEIKELEDHKTWIAIPKSKVPKDVRVLPSTWVFRIKRFPDGRKRKYKARFCVRGDRQIEESTTMKSTHLWFHGLPYG